MEIREVYVSYGVERTIECSTIRSALGAANFFRKITPDNSREHVIALYLDASHKPISYSLVATGSATECTVHPREIFQRAVLVGAKAIIMAHNHPSQSVDPSKSDHDITRRIRDAGELLDIKLLDHIVFSDSKHFSFLEKGFL